MARPDERLSARELHERMCNEGIEEEREERDAAAAERRAEHYDPLPPWHPWLQKASTPAPTAAPRQTPTTTHTTSEEGDDMATTSPESAAA